MSKSTYFILILVLSVNSCSLKSIPRQDMQSVKEAQVENKPEKSAIDSAQVIQINNRNRKKSILNSSKSEKKKRIVVTISCIPLPIV